MKNLIIGFIIFGVATAFAQYQPKFPDIKYLGKVKLLSINEFASIPVVDYESINAQQAQLAQSPIGHIYVHCSGVGTTQMQQCGE